MHSGNLVKVPNFVNFNMLFIRDYKVRIVIIINQVMFFVNKLYFVLMKHCLEKFCRADFLCPGFWSGNRLIFVFVSFQFLDILKFKKNEKQISNTSKAFGWRKKIQESENMFMLRFGDALLCWNTFILWHKCTKHKL